MPDGNIPQHSLLSPSGAETWVNCPGSVEAQRGEPDSTSKAAAEGTCAHELAAMCLERDESPDEWMGEVLEADDFEFTVDNEMVDNVQAYLDYIANIRAGISPKHRHESIECRVHTSIEECNGTADDLIYDEKARHLHVIDLKYGKGVKVFAKDNKQELIYGWGSARETNLRTKKLPRKISLHIVQPRLGHFDCVEYDFLDFMEKIVVIKDAAIEALKPGAKRIPGKKQCQWCRAKSTCPELSDYVDQTVLDEFPMLDVEPEVFDGEYLSGAMSRVDLVKSWASAVEQRTFEEIHSGHAVPDYKIVAGRSTRSFKGDDEAVEKELRKRKLKVAEIFIKKLVTAPQLEKVVGKKTFLAKFADLIHKPKGKPTLAHVSDNRPSIDFSEQFEDLTQPSTE